MMTRLVTDQSRRRPGDEQYCLGRLVLAVGSGLHALLLQEKIVATSLNKFTDFLGKTTTLIQNMW